jgi:acetone carboxylase gamma subunit
MAGKTYDKSAIADLIDGKMPWHDLKDMMSSHKDPDRFTKYLEVLQERVPWDDRILLPLGPHLFIVQKADASIVTKSTSGFEFGDYRKNWKLKARIFVRRTDADYRQIYTEMTHPDPQWMELREFYDPLDGTLLDIEVVPPCYPLIHSFEPDLEVFYTQWLGKPFPPPRG